MEYVGLIILLVVFIILSMVVGSYLYKIVFKKESKGDRLFDPIDNFIYKICKINGREMNWKQYLMAVFITNGMLFLCGCILLVVQGIVTKNSNFDLSLTTIFNIASSFITNTNLQNYTGEVNLTNMSQMAVITMYMFTSAGTGFAIAGAFIRGVTGNGIGNFYRDLVRIITRFLLPISFLVAIVLIWQGVPQTLESGRVISTLEGGTQSISYGPVASLESIKHLGTNGGGFFSGNSAHPFENPTAFTNLLEMLLMMVSPGAYCFMFGKACKNKKQGYVIFFSAFILLAISLVFMIKAEYGGNPMLNSMGIENSLGNMEGKEVRFGSFDSSVFSVVTTSFTTGSVNNMHDSLTPIGGGVTMWNMMLNTIYGGKGVGFLNIIVYGMLGIFICGLMVGRTPEFLKRKIEGREMKLISGIILIHPILILVPTAITLILGQNTLDGFHGLSQVLYEFTTSAVNNGSAFEGLQDSTTFYNVITGVIMLLGRYISMGLMLALAGGMSEKTPVASDSISFRTDTVLFGGVLIGTILIIGALTFLPVLVLGPGAEFLSM